ncbi:hypothetical protein B4135_3278 [Caldibacillus debilis]|uniref:DUF1510 domain-containing protein n=1 Tax=Caldibacillus debilis TaxID=301148 RepID=A0A150LFM7_9BACI|nr:hypothetical protein B4135_3278 [Caldibacillus debilis]
MIAILPKEGKKLPENQYYPPFRTSRSEQYAKKRKENFILNLLIAVVFLLIIIVAFSILTGKPADQAGGGDHAEKTGENAAAEHKNSKEEGKGEASGAGVSSENAASEGEADETATGGGEDAAESQTVSGSAENREVEIAESENDPNVIKTVVNPSWEPVGTVQSGQHVTRYDEGTVDRREMDRAMAYAAGLAEDDMIVWWVGHGGEPNRNVIGTITSKDQTKIFRVYLEWVDGQGWKPVKLQYLRENDKKR